MLSQSMVVMTMMVKASLLCVRTFQIRHARDLSLREPVDSFGIRGMVRDEHARLRDV